jgi:hypothetical protein
VDGGGPHGALTPCSASTSQASARLVDHVIAQVPVRQWVLSLPIPLRPLQAAAVTYRIAFGSRAGQRVLTLRGDARCDRPGSPARPRRAGTARRFDDARLRPGGRRCPQETGDRPARQGPLCIAVSTAPGTSMSISNPRRDMGRQTAARYRACDLTGRRD